MLLVRRLALDHFAFYPSPPSHLPRHARPPSPPPLEPGRFTIRDADTVDVVVQKLHAKFPEQVPLREAWDSGARANAGGHGSMMRHVRTVLICHDVVLQPQNSLGPQCLEAGFTMRAHLARKRAMAMVQAKLGEQGGMFAGSKASNAAVHSKAYRAARTANLCGRAGTQAASHKLGTQPSASALPPRSVSSHRGGPPRLDAHASAPSAPMHRKPPGLLADGPVVAVSAMAAGQPTNELAMLRRPRSAPALALSSRGGSAAL